MTTIKYDSTEDTKKHIRMVGALLYEFSTALANRSAEHDKSKLEEPEKAIFDIYTPKLRNTTYGSEEYGRNLAEMRQALEHHHTANRHHPEYFGNGVAGMTLLDLVEMFFDWKAATQRHADGDIYKSIEINQKRFGFSDDIASILRNTANMIDDEWLLS